MTELKYMRDCLYEAAHRHASECKNHILQKEYLLAYGSVCKVLSCLQIILDRTYSLFDNDRRMVEERIAEWIEYKDKVFDLAHNQ